MLVQDIEKARGLITFTVAMGTIIIALILVLVTLLGSWPDSQERFNRGKEILAILVGILGTIVGYYYGAADSAQTPAPTPAAEEGAPNANGAEARPPNQEGNN